MNTLLKERIQSYTSFDELKSEFAFDASSLKQLVKDLVELEEAGVIVQVNEGYDIAANQNVYTGTLSINKKGYGFVFVDSFEEDVFIPEKELHSSLDGDEVLIQLMMEDGVRVSAKFLKTLKRPNPVLVGMVKGSLVIPDIGSVSKIRLTNKANAHDGDKVQVLITNVYQHRFEGHIINVLGPADAPGMDITSIAARYQFPLAFNEAALAEANQATMNDNTPRRDLREMDLVTIDGVDAKDFDDAVFAKQTESGFEVTVAIADVAQFVEKISALDQEAYARGTSVYLADRVIPMLPEALSNDLCSLKPHEDRYCVCVTMHLNDKGEREYFDVYEGLMRSKRRLTYGEVNQFLTNQESLGDESMDSLVTTLNAVANRLMKRRHQRGALFFTTHESQISLNDEGVPIHISLRDRGPGEMLIEELMLLANETVAEYLTEMGMPILYRTHDAPDPTKLFQLIRFIRMRGIGVKGTKEHVHVKELQQVLEAIVDIPGGAAISSMMIRSMAKAVYEPFHQPHYGLASSTYAHFTSPIRRYPDLTVHRAIKTVLRHGMPSKKAIEALQAELVVTGRQASKKERLAIACERDVTQMKMAEYMQNFIGKHFDGVISGVTNFGLFVEIANGIEGLVRMEDMRDDYYRFDPDRLVLVGRRLKRVYTIGDTVKVTCTNASKLTSRIDFVIRVKGGAHATPRRKNRRKK